MTEHKHLKQRVRARMEKTGERYASARRHVVGEANPPAASPPDHYPGSVPATTALRTLLAHGGVRDPRTGEPFDEAMLFGLAGGVGIGVFAMAYEAEDFASFYVAGRHRWQDDLGYLADAAALLGARAEVVEHGGAGKAEASLKEALAEGRPCVAWVDAAGLPHRAMPQQWSGGGYHVVTVHLIDEAAGVAWIGDLADELVPIGLAELAAARARIKKQKNRLLTLTAGGGPIDLREAITEALRRCHAGLGGAWSFGSRTNFSLDALGVWAERMGGRGKDSWERVFPPGHRLWSGLTSLHDFVEHYGTGGGLCRPLFADFLGEAGGALGDDGLLDLAGRYADLGRAWSDLAQAALPDEVPLLAAARALADRRAELLADGASPDEIRAVWAELQGLAGEARERFPLDEAGCEALRSGLATRIAALHAGEVAAREAMGAIIASA